MIIEEIKVYPILNSIGLLATEVEMISDKGFHAIASSPSALLPGKREILSNVEIDNKDLKSLILNLVHRDFKYQQDIDDILHNYLNILGSSICLPISLAFARLSAIHARCSLTQYIANEVNYSAKHILPSPMVTVFSGGVHSQNQNTIQNIMIISMANSCSFFDSIDITSRIYTQIESYLKSHGYLEGYGQSSGLISANGTLSTIQKFDLISEMIQKEHFEGNLSIAIDVAAEHLFNKTHNNYCFENEYLEGYEFSKILQKYINEYPISFIEDPFDSSNEELWKSFIKCNPHICVAGDDLFATQTKFVNDELANGIIIKMNQAGTLSNTLQTICMAKSLGMSQCVSHRSVETEDTFMCDLAVAFDSDYIKIGGPRRGDRITKYNRMIRLGKEK